MFCILCYPGAFRHSGDPRKEASWSWVATTIDTQWTCLLLFCMQSSFWILNVIASFCSPDCASRLEHPVYVLLKTHGHLKTTSLLCSGCSYNDSREMGGFIIKQDILCEWHICSTTSLIPYLTLNHLSVTEKKHWERRREPLYHWKMNFS